MLDVYTTRAKWLMAAYNDKYHPEQLIRVADYIKRSEALQSSFGDQGSLLQLYFVKLMFAAINYDAKGALCWLDKGRFLKENSSMICVKNNDFYEFWLTNYLLKLDLPADIKAQLSKIVANRPGS